MTTRTTSVNAMISTGASTVKLANSTVQIRHVEYIKNVLMMLRVHLVIGVIVRQDLLVMTVKWISMIVRG